MNDLRTCPFCGGEVNITYISADNVFSIWHKDDKCMFIEPLYIDGKNAKSLSDAINIWNNQKNVPMKTPEEIVMCKDCRYADISPSGLIKCRGIFRSKEWYCADGKRKEGAK